MYLSRKTETDGAQKNRMPLPENGYGHSSSSLLAITAVLLILLVLALLVLFVLTVLLILTVLFVLPILLIAHDNNVPFV